MINMHYTDIMASLNEQQQKAINHFDGPCLVMAGAGSGKTTVLTTRIISLIDNGVSDYNILAITFTNKAAQEMRDRVNNYYGSVSSFIGTFHSFGLKVIRENYKECGLSANFTIVDSDDTLLIIKKILKDNNYSLDEYNPYVVRSKISSFKNEMLSDKELDNLFRTHDDRVCISIYKKYQQILLDSNVVDFDDLLVMPVKLFMNNEEILNHYQEHYPFILVDEYQDTNPVQYKMCKLLSSKYRNIFVVGDMNQSIYGFRQADYRNIMNFEKDYPECVVIKLEENYRSTNNILNAANSVIKNNRERKDLKLFSHKGDGEKIRYISTLDERSEASRIVDEIIKLESLGYKGEDIVVLYRTNAQSRALEEQFTTRNVSYRVIGGYYFYNRKEIKDLLAYLKLIYNTNDSISLRRIINFPKRGIGDKAIENLEALAKLNNNSLFDNLSTKKELEFKELIDELIKDSENMSLTDLVETVLDKSGIWKEYSQDMSLEGQNKLEFLEEFKSSAANFQEESGTSDLGDYLKKLGLYSDKQDSYPDENKVTLMTIHSAKGLEFKVVFIAGMEEKLFPHSISINDGDIEEERRLFYVGITRAKELLYLTNALSRTLFGKKDERVESEFIKEIDPCLIEQIGNTKFNANKCNKEEMYQEGNNDDIKIGDTIEHETKGLGVVVRVDGSLIDVAFKTGIVKLMKNHKSIKKK